MSIFAERLRELRKAVGMSQTKFAKEVNSTRPSISAYEVADRTPNVDFLATVAKRFNVTADWLLGITDVSIDRATKEEIYALGFEHGDKACMDALHTFLKRR